MSSESVCQVSRSWVVVGSFHTRLFEVVDVTCDEFQDGSEKGIASVHKLLRQSWEKWYGDSHNDSTSLRGPKLESWHARFKTSRTPVDDDECTGRHTSCTTPETVARIQELLHQDRRRTIHDIAEEVGIGYGACQRVLTEKLGMHRVAAKFLPRILTADQRQQRVSVCTELNWTEKQNGCHPPPTVLSWFGTLWLIPISKNEIVSERTPVWYHWEDTVRIAESAWRSDRKELPGSVPKMKETVGPVSTCGRELLRGWRGRWALWWVLWILQRQSGKFWIPPCTDTIMLSEKFVNLCCYKRKNLKENKMDRERSTHGKDYKYKHGHLCAPWMGFMRNNPWCKSELEQILKK
jgi:hypothetical protein